MSTKSLLHTLEAEAGAQFQAFAERSVPMHFGDSRREYDLLHDGVGLHDRSLRGVIEITGADRAAWLHNLTTNEVADVPAGQARYTFACNVKGRILFDANVLILPDAIRLDLDVRNAQLALQHLDKYHITEDVAVAERSNDYVRLALTGRGRHDLLDPDRSGSALTARKTEVGGVEMWALRSDFCGLPGVELFVPVGSEVNVWKALRGSGAEPVGSIAVDIRRIEAGLPWSCQDIDPDVLPAETGQSARAVCYTKGCYLGQEVVERMRARGAVARRFVGLRSAGAEPFPAGASLVSEDTTIGRVTSACVSPAVGAPIGLGYVRATLAEPGTPLHAVWETGRADVTVAALPFVS